MLKDMFKKTYTRIDERHRMSRKEEPNIPEGLWKKCNKCGQPVYVEDVRQNFYICPKCKGYFRVHARRRIEMVADEGTFEEWDARMEFCNPLNFPGYEAKVESVREKTGLSEAVVTGTCRIGGFPVAIGVCDARFLMSSMGHVVGEKITRLTERATKEQIPVILFACSGGARMQEGIVSLMQMAKTSAALKRHQEAGQLYISVLTDPTTGGVTASFAMLGDVILAEPGALIGFAGPRVIQQTIGQKLPEISAGRISFGAWICGQDRQAGRNEADTGTDFETSSASGSVCGYVPGKMVWHCGKRQRGKAVLWKNQRERKDSVGNGAFIKEGRPSHSTGLYRTDL